MAFTNVVSDTLDARDAIASTGEDPTDPTSSNYSPSFISPRAPLTGTSTGTSTSTTNGFSGPIQDPAITQVQDAEAEKEETAEELAAKNKSVRDEMEQNYTDPTGALADKNLEQTYTQENSYLKDATTGELLLDAAGNPQEDMSLALDPLQFQLEQQQHAAAAQAQAEQAGYELADLTTAEYGGDVDPAKVAATKAAEAEKVAIADFETSLLNPEDLHKSIDAIAELEPMKAASVAANMNELLAEMENGEVPLWARPAVTQVEQALAARGISASSIGRDSLFNSIIQSALPIATADATHQQEANATNYTAKVNALMSDVSAANAALQFNATTQNQAEQFRVQLKAQVDEQNAARADALSQFNAAAAMDIAKFNSEQENAIQLENAKRLEQLSQFNAEQSNSISVENARTRTAVAEANAERNTRISEVNAASRNAMIQFTENLDSQRDQFNATMSAQISQATVQWRRQMNTENTAGQNAVNQANAQNAFNLSNQALTNLWQEVRDEAQWSFLASESTKDRRAQLEASVLARESSTASEIGQFLGDLDIDADYIVDGVKDGWKFVSGLFD